MLPPQRKGHPRKKDPRRKVSDSRLREQQCKGTEARKRPKNELECEGWGTMRGGGHAGTRQGETSFYQETELSQDSGHH